MKYSIRSLPKFERELKRLVRKFPSLKSEFANLVESLEEEPEQGQPLGKKCYKIRLSLASKGKGKSGGARIITYMQVTAETVILLTIYDKSEKESLSDLQLTSLLRDI